MLIGTFCCWFGLDLLDVGTFRCRFELGLLGEEGGVDNLVVVKHFLFEDIEIKGVENRES